MSHSIIKAILSVCILLVVVQPNWFLVDLDGYLGEFTELGVVDSSSDMSVDMAPFEGFSSSDSSSVGKTDGSILIFTGLNLEILRAMVWSSFVAVIVVPFLATTLTRFAIQAKGPDGKWTRKPFAYRESNNVHLLITRPHEICVYLIFKHIHAASSYTICRQFVPFIYLHIYINFQNI